ncbi:hypothetical protein C8R43DRAFT_1199478 [Mycena crocata]|nr:hypothetical protein C8R43DRAFT_1199478 [Mycena crocata]
MKKDGVREFALSKTRSRSWRCTHDQTFRPTSILHVAILRVRWSRLRETAGCTRTNGMMSATASLGLSLLSDTDLGLSHVNKYTYSAEEYIKAGALLATVILNNGVRTEADVAKGLIGETSTTSQCLGLAYADSHVLAQMHYDKPVIRKSVLLAIGLVSISNPQLPILRSITKQNPHPDHPNGDWIPGSILQHG